jgi:hypothetical protein
MYTLGVFARGQGIYFVFLDIIKLGVHKEGCSSRTEDVVEFPTAEEEAVYHMLQQVLVNHMQGHDLHVMTASTAVIYLLGDVALQLSAAERSIQTFAQECGAGLKQRLRARHDAPALPRLAPVTLGDEGALLPEEPVCGLINSLEQFLADASAEHDIALDGSLRIILSLLADLLAVFLHQLDHTLEEVDALIEQEVVPLLQYYVTRKRSFRPHGRL